MIEKDKLVRFLISRLAPHADSFMGAIDAGRLEELCFLIRAAMFSKLDVDSNPPRPINDLSALAQMSQQRAP